jgi:DtxR family Mn-dependent transcriptional regulator
MHTLSEENYLKTIYRLSQDEGVKITPTAIAEVVEKQPGIGSGYDTQAYR